MRRRARAGSRSTAASTSSSGSGKVGSGGSIVTSGTRACRRRSDEIGHAIATAPASASWPGKRRLTALSRSRFCLCLLVALALSGCMFRDLKRNLAEKAEYAVLRGTVHTEHPTDLPILVVIYTGEKGN